MGVRLAGSWRIGWLYVLASALGVVITVITVGSVRLALNFWFFLQAKEVDASCCARSCRGGFAKRAWSVIKSPGNQLLQHAAP